MLYKSLRNPLFCFLLGLMILLLTACNAPAMVSVATSTTAMKVQSTPAFAPTSTSCPAQGSGRSAVLPPITTKQNQHVVYLSQSNTSTIVRSYDTVTGNTKDLFTSHAYTNIEASVSPDSHWITLTSQLPGGSYAIQLVRSDGSYAQTVYCSKGADFIDGALLSPDQHHLAFNEKNQTTLTTTLNILDTITGKIQTELSSQLLGYPHYRLAHLGSASQADVQAKPQGSQYQVLSYATTLLPKPGLPPLNAFVPIRWASNKSLYLLAMPTVASSGAIPHQLYQLLDINKLVDQQSTNLKAITAPLKQNGCWRYDITADTTHLICSAGPSTPIDKTVPAVSVEPIAGGTLKTVFQAPTNSQVIARAAQGQTLLFAVNNGGKGSQLYRVQTNGTHLNLLTSTSYSNTPYLIGSLTAGFLPWTNVSFDAQKYALETADKNGFNDLVIGSMNGGATRTIATHIGTLIGWTAASVDQ